MKKGAIIALVILGVFLLAGFGIVSWGISVYNNLISMEQGVNNSWSQVENQYQRRMDLIPNLVNTVKGVANFERGTLTDVINARAKATQVQVTPETLNDPQAFQKFQQAQGDISSALSRLLVTVENYPTLKANENFLQLQAQLEGTENRIAVARMEFNNVVQTYNTSLKRFPANIVAGFSGFKEKQYFTAQAGAETAPKVEF
jgi:LemA protein